MTPKIIPYKNIVAKIYAYTTPGVSYKVGWLKIGYTEKDVEERIDEQTQTSWTDYQIEWIEFAPFDEKNNKQLKDTDFHRFLIDKYHVEFNPAHREWFKISPALARKYFYEFCAGKSARKKSAVKKNYNLREEQENAVNLTLKYFLEEKTPREFLWNAKPRFGKTLSTYDFILNAEVTKVLIVTNRPSISNSWYRDFADYVSWREQNFKFVSTTDSLKGKSNLSYNDYCKLYPNSPFIAFISLQDLKGAKDFGGDFDKLGWIKNLHFDLLVVDESHEGVDTEKTFAAFQNIRRKFTLYLSGTPFKALAENKFGAEQIFNWSYADEQNAKLNWRGETSNPYEDMPRMNLFSYKLSNIFKEKVASDYLYDLNEFFETDDKGNFLYENDVKKFLDALTTQEKFPFSTPALRAELKHTFWLMYRVDGVKAMAKLLKEHKIFKEYKIVIAAGDGKISDEETQNEKSFDKVTAAIANSEKTITLSVGQLTTGVTIREWTAVLMLNGMKSATQYLQAAFRAQNPCAVKVDDKTVSRKENCYVFDFDPARALEIFNKYAANLGSSDEGNGNSVEKLRKVLPVFAENDAGEMVELDAKEIMSLPQKIAAAQVVDCRFMSNALFNINHVFNLPADIRKIIDKMLGDDTEKPKINPGGDEKNKPKKPKKPRPKLPPNATVLQIVQSIEEEGYKVSPAQKRRIAELVKQNVDAETITEQFIAEMQERQNLNDARAKLRSFAATIPSFIMAYGDENLTLANFDSYLDDKTFQQITGITLAEFKILRDGGEIDGEYFEGGIFNEDVFNAAVQEFLARMEEYADYFDENNDKDIFDFIPPQKTSQIFTPRFIVRQMVDALELENPNIFDNPAQKFFDPYIKSGLYLAEIVKRLYKNKKICAAFPNDAARLKHILENQVYGCAPTEIIFRIATRYIFGNRPISQKNFRKIDTLASLRDGNISDLLKNIFSVKVIILNKDRVKKFGEVFTPQEIVNFMLDIEELADVFEILDAKILEPTAGDGAFLVGILERKLKLAKNPLDAFIALSSIYGIEIQPDNLAYARKNVADTFKNHYGNISAEEEKIMWGIINANIVQGNALTKKMKTYLSKKKDNAAKNEEPGEPLTFIDWNLDSAKPPQIFRYEVLTSGGAMTYYDFNLALIIGNPPYQGETSGDNKTFTKPVYHLFLQSFWQACNRVMMIHPARCLFNAGATPKDFMKKLLNDEHLKVIHYEPNSKAIFKDADIKGGVAVTYRDENISFGKIEVFIPFNELKSIWQKVFKDNEKNFKSLSKIMQGVGIYHYTEQLHIENPTAASRMSKGHAYDVKTNALENFPDIFFEEKPNDGNEYIQILGRIDNQRVYRWIRRDFIKDIPSLHCYKVILPKAYGAGAIGENGATTLVGLPLVGLPLVGYTETFITLGNFHSAAEAEICAKYVKTKFARALLGILKITQEATPEKWKYVPLQDFTNGSDIDWSRSIHEIDLQLYRKYNLSLEEIIFIETKVRAME